MSIDHYAALLLTASVILEVAWLGFTRQSDQFGSWGMFAQICYYRLSLTNVKTGSAVNCWDFELHQDHFGSIYEVRTFLAYLKDELDVTVQGEGVLVGSFGLLRLRIESNEVMRI